MSLDVMKQALEALERGETKLRYEAITALRAAIEQAQEPVAWISEGGDVSRSKRYMDEMGFKCNPLYTAPRQWQGLTNDEIDTLYEAHHNQYGECKVVGYGYERAIEAKLKEKNT